MTLFHRPLNFYGGCGCAGAKEDPPGGGGGGGNNTVNQSTVNRVTEQWATGPVKAPFQKGSFSVRKMYEN